MSFAEMFDKLVVAHGYTAYSLSSKIGISENLLNKYRKGKAYPGGENMLKILTFFNLPIDYFNVDKKTSPPPVDGELERMKEELWIKFKDATPEMQEVVLQFLASRRKGNQGKE